MRKLNLEAVKKSSGFSYSTSLSKDDLNNLRGGGCGCVTTDWDSEGQRVVVDEDPDHCYPDTHNY